MKIRFYNIDWDSENGVILPNEVTLVIGDEDMEIDSDGADLLSVEYGFCVNSFNWEKV